MRSPALAVAALLFSLTTPLFAAARAAVPPTVDLTPQFRSAGVIIDGLQAFDVGGVVIIRGRAYDRAVAENAGRVAQDLGYTRVANLVRVMDRPDDAKIEREAERELSVHPSMSGTSLHVASQRGVVRVGGRVQHELQKDLAVQLLRNIRGVVEVRSELWR